MYGIRCIQINCIELLQTQPQEGLLVGNFLTGTLTGTQLLLETDEGHRVKATFRQIDIFLEAGGKGVSLSTMPSKQIEGGPKVLVKVLGLKKTMLDLLEETLALGCLLTGHSSRFVLQPEFGSSGQQQWRCYRRLELLKQSGLISERFWENYL